MQHNIITRKLHPPFHLVGNFSCSCKKIYWRDQRGKKFFIQTFTPNNLSATNNVEKTNRIRNPIPSADASNQFRSSDNFLTLNKVKRSYCGLMVLLSKNIAPISSKVWKTSKERPCTEDKVKDQCAG